MLVCSWFIGTLINYVAVFYIFKYIISGNKKIEITISKTISLIILALINCILLNYNIIDIKPYVLQIILFVELKIIYKNSFVKTLLGIILSLIIIGTSEMIFGIIYNTLKSNINNFDIIFIGKVMNNYIVINIIISLFMIFLIKIFNILFFSIVRWYKENGKIRIIIFWLLILTIFMFLLYNNFISIMSPTLLLFLNLFCIGVFVFVLGFFKEKTNNNKLKSEYQQLLSYISTYEKLLDEKMKQQHEFKNQLIIVNDMVKNKKAKEYINSILDIEEENIEYSWINKLKNLPNGGLKGLVYYKIQKMLENKIDVFVDISDELSDEKKWNKCNSNLKDVSMILGIFLDNAIEACIEATKKSIIIDAYLEDGSICIGVSNTYKNIKLDKLNKDRYTTKGDGHGYGLSIVKDILNNNDKIINKREISSTYYTQRIYIKK